MPVDFRRSTIAIPFGTTGEFEAEHFVSFDDPVLRAEIAIQSFNVEYDDDVARHLANLDVRTDMRPFSEGIDTDVRYQIDVELADKTGGESYHGHVSVVVIAEVT